MNIAIVAVAYNRVDSLSRLLESVSKAYYDDDNVSLVISVDKSKTDTVECFADDFQWNHGPKIVDKHEKNLGLRPHMMSLGKWFDKFDAIIVLEDDLIVARSFYLYAKQTVEKYHSDDNIAGISLYSQMLNAQSLTLFNPEKTYFDVFFMNRAMSWGEVWMKDSWLKFYDWYQTHQDFPVQLPHLPKNVIKWDSRSWLKYHMRYCIEQNKYFVHPYTSYSTNSSDAGEHSKSSSSNFQVSLQQGYAGTLNLPNFSECEVRYDGFFENKTLYSKLELSESEVCIDLNGGKSNREHRRFWLTCEVHNYKIIKSYALSLRPIEQNVLDDLSGNDIFLYDTSVVENNPFKGKNASPLMYSLRYDSMATIIHKYGFCKTIKSVLSAVVKRIF